MLLLAVFMICSCKDSNPSVNYDKLGYNIKIEFDANGSFFGNSTQQKISDYYKLETLMTNENGMRELKIIDPESQIRNNIAPGNAHELSRVAVKGYSFAGWYTEKTAKTDENGNTYYEYGGKWDFETDVLEIDPTKNYTASEPVITLYAAWVKTPTIEIIDGETSLGKIEIGNPANASNTTIDAPYFDLEKYEYNFGILKSLLSERILTGDIAKVTSFYEGLYFDK